MSPLKFSSAARRSIRTADLLHTPSEKPFTNAVGRVSGFDFRSDLTTLNLSLAEVGINVILVAQIVSDHIVDVG
jgi:hypothetical protein